MAMYVVIGNFSLATKLLRFNALPAFFSVNDVLITENDILF